MLPTTAIAWVAFLATVLGAVLSYAIAVVASRREEETPRVRGYARYMVAGGTWAAAYAAILLSDGGVLTAVFDVLRVIAAVAALWTFLLFVVNYTGERDRLFPILSRLFVLDLVGYTTLYATNDVHGLLYETNAPLTVDGLTLLEQEPSVLFLLHYLVLMAVLLYGFWLLGRFLFATRNVYREQTAAVLVGSFSTTVAGALVTFNVAGAGPWQYFDPTPITFALNGLIVAWALFRFDFLTVGPLAANTLIEELEDPVLVLDDDDRIIDANPAATTLFGTDVTGQPVGAAMPRVAGAIANDESVTLSPADETGRSVVYDPRTTPLYGPYDDRRGCIVVLHDVTERIERERLLERRNEQLDEFASVVSHDLRNPLTVAQGYAEQAKETGDPDDVAEVQTALDRMDELVTDLLALARNERDSFDLEDVSLDRTASLAWDAVDTGDASLVVTADRAARADPSRLRQLFENLFRNSVEHGATSDRSAAADGGDDAAPLTVTVGDLDDGFYVADDGVGIPPEDRTDVFESGYTTDAAGTGYGLAIVESVAEGHGWDVALTESEDGGARFEFRDATRPGGD